MKKITKMTTLFYSIFVLVIGASTTSYALEANDASELFNAPPQPAGFVAFDNIGGVPVDSGEAFLACGPNDVANDADVEYRLHYAITADNIQDPLTADEYIFGNTAGDGDANNAFGFTITGLQPGTDYTFWLYQYNTVDELYSTPAVANIVTGGEGNGGGDPDPQDPIEPVFTLIQDFEDSSSFTFTGFEGLAGATIEAAPTGDNGNSLKLESISTGNPWQGAEIVQLIDLLNLTSDKTVQIDVYATQAFNLLLKVENGGPNSAASQSYTEPNTWQTLTFTMDESLDNTAVANGIYEKIVFFPNWNNTDSGFNTPANFTVYVDNINGFTAGTDTDPDPVDPELALVQDFEDDSTFDFLDFEGLGGATIEMAPSGNNGNSLKLESLASGNPWQGGLVDQLETFLDLTSNKTIQVDVFSTQTFNLLLKVENGGPDAAASQSYTTPNEWQTLTFTMDESLDGTNIANGIYERIVFFPNWGDNNTEFGTPSTFTVFVDNIASVPSSQNGGGNGGGGDTGEIGEEEVTVDASASWLGFANVFEAPAGETFIFGSPWARQDVRTDIDTENNTLILFPNFNTYADNPGDDFWINPTTGEGNKIFEGITFVESTSLIGSVVTFRGNVESFTLSPDYEVEAFIRVFNADFSQNKPVLVTLTGTGNFELIYDDVDLNFDVTLQYGFAVKGRNANPANMAALGNVVVGPTTLSSTQFETIDLQVYPNPVSDVLHIKSASNFSSIELYNINGRLVTKQQNVNTIDMRDFANGMYILKLTSNGNSITRKVIKK